MSEEINQEQLSILDHTINRAANHHYCGGGPDMDKLVDLGLMMCIGKKSFVPDDYYTITAKGRELFKQIKS